MDMNLRNCQGDPGTRILSHLFQRLVANFADASEVRRRAGYGASPFQPFCRRIVTRNRCREAIDFLPVFGEVIDRHSQTMSSGIRR